MQSCKYYLQKRNKQSHHSGFVTQSHSQLGFGRQATSALRRLSPATPPERRNQGRQWAQTAPHRRRPHSHHRQCQR